MDETYNQENLRREVDRFLTESLTGFRGELSDMRSLIERIVTIEQRTLSLLERDKEDRVQIIELLRRVSDLEIVDARTDAGVIGPIKLVVGAVIGGLIAWLFSKI